MFLAQQAVQSDCPSSAVIEVHEVSKTYRIYAHPHERLLQGFFPHKQYYREHQALKPLSFSVMPGEAVGIVGTNGSGKSTLLQMVCGTLTPTSGTLNTQGRISALLELGAGFNPAFSGYENIRLNASILGMSKEELEQKHPQIVEFSGLEDAMLVRPVSTYSSGMYIRLAFSVAIALEPDLLVVDEALAVGDEAFQRKCFARISALKEQGTAILFVSHASATVINLCDRALWLDQGDLMMDSIPREVIAAYHQYIYAPVQNQLALREQILKGEQQTQSVAQQTSKLAESCVIYPSNGGEISAIELLDDAGQPARNLDYGKTYQLRYQASFTEDFEKVRFAMFIKTKLGVELAGSILHEASRPFKQGDKVTATFTFTCHLLEGTYYLNCGISRPHDGEDMFIHRLVDALEFRVMPISELNGNQEPRGLVDLRIEGEVEY